MLDAAGARAELDSPLWAGGLKYTTGNAMVDPGRLAWGLRRACLEAGVRIYERTPAISLSGVAAGAGMQVRTPYGSVRAAKVALAAGVPGGSLLRRIGAYVVPVWDYVLMTEPLSAAQLDSLGWRHRRGASDLGNQFHYFRLTRDNRVLWGGYDAVYYNGGRIREEHVDRPATFAKLAAQFFATFPQLEGAAFTHAWGGVIDTCSRFCAFYGTALTRAGSRTRRGTRDSASARPASPARCCSTSCTARIPNDCGWPSSTASHCPSRRSRCAQASSRRPARRSPARTGTRGAGTCGCARSTA